MDILPIFFIGFSVCWYALQAESLIYRNAASRLQRLLGFIFLWWGLSTLKDLLLYFPGIDSDVMLNHIYYIDGFGAVTFALLLMELTMPGWVSIKRVVILSLPFIAFFVCHFFIREQWIDRAYTIFFVTFAWIAFLVGVWKGRCYARAIRENYSDLEDVDISWIWGILVAFFLCQHVWWAVADTSDWLANSFYYLASLFCWNFTLSGVNRLRPLRLPVVETAVPMKKSVRLAERLERLMTDEQLYLNAELTMSDLVQCLATNRTYLSDCFSNELNTTFYDYINRQRIERSVLPLMQSDDTLSLEQIATRSGFKSMSTFRRAFRKLTGLLPSEYQDSNSITQAKTSVIASKSLPTP